MTDSANIFAMSRKITKTHPSQSLVILIFLTTPNNTWRSAGFPYIKIARKAARIYKNSHSKSAHLIPTAFIQLIYPCFSRCHVNTNSVALSPLFKPHTTRNSSIHSDEGLTLETSTFRIPIGWSIYIINSVDNTKFLISFMLNVIELQPMPHISTYHSCQSKGSTPYNQLYEVTLP